MVKPPQVYCDGGLIGPNPSPKGGTWAYVWVDDHNVRILSRSGLVRPDDLGVDRVTNNHTELFAAILALESVKAGQGWTGTLFTDSKVTRDRLSRLSRGMTVNDCPQWMVDRARVLCVDRQWSVVLMAGHPTRKELMAGRRKRNGLPTSEHNVECDRLCCEQAFHQGRK